MSAPAEISSRATFAGILFGRVGNSGVKQLHRGLLVAMRENGDVMDRYGRHFVTAMVILELVRPVLKPLARLVLRTVLKDNDENDESGRVVDKWLQAVIVIKVARLFFYVFVWAPLTVRLGRLGSIQDCLPLKWLGRGGDRVPDNPRRGKRGFCLREVTDDSRSLAYNTYFHVLRLPLPLFLLCWFSTYVMVNVFFACLYYLDVDGLHVERKTNWPTWMEGIFTKHVTSWLTVFFYSSSILTNFSGSGADAHSPYMHMLGNAHAMLAQFVSLFWFNACFKRISKSVNIIRWSPVAAVTCAAPAASGCSNNKRSRTLTIRFDVVRPYSTGLIDAKFDLVCVKANCLRIPSQSGVQLNLVNREAVNISHGASLEHVLNEDSPLYSLDMENLRHHDVILRVAVRGVDKTSMKPVFSERLYSAHDDDILWDCAFQDQMYCDESGSSVYDFTLLSKFRTTS